MERLDLIEQNEESGLVADQAALFGVLSKIHALNLILISVNRWSSQKMDRGQ